MGAMGRGTTPSTSEYRSFFPTIVRSTLRKLKYGNVGRGVRGVLWSVWRGSVVGDFGNVRALSLTLHTLVPASLHSGCASTPAPSTPASRTCPRAWRT